MCALMMLGGMLFFHVVVEEIGWFTDDGDVEEENGRCLICTL